MVDANKYQGKAGRVFIFCKKFSGTTNTNQGVKNKKTKEESSTNTTIIFF